MYRVGSVIAELVVIVAIFAVGLCVLSPVGSPIYLDYWLDGLVAVAFLFAVFGAVRAFVGQNRRVAVAIAATLLCVCVGLIAGCSADPVAKLTPILEHVRTHGTKDRVLPTERAAYLEKEKLLRGWRKRKLHAENVEYDIRKTDSLVSPIQAEVKFSSYECNSPVSSSKEVAERMELPTNPDWHNEPRYLYGKWEVDLSLDSGRWIVKDVFYIGKRDILNLEAIHDMGDDWQEAFSTR